MTRRASFRCPNCGAPLHAEDRGDKLRVQLDRGWLLAMREFWKAFDGVFKAMNNVFQRMR